MTLSTFAAAWLGYRQGQRRQRAETTKTEKESKSIDARLYEYKDKQMEKLLRENETITAQNVALKKLIEGLEEEIMNLKITNTLYKTLKA